MSKRAIKKASVVSVVQLHGAIMAGPKGINIDTYRPVIDKAFDEKHLAAVVLDINSPGGSPVQSAAVANYIQQKSAHKQVPVFACIQDVAASGGYWIACAANGICANPMSIVGSVGVVSSGFNFHELINMLGIKRIVRTSGKNKVTGDPFSPHDPNDPAEAKREKLQRNIHDQFIGWVRACRHEQSNRKVPNPLKEVGTTGQAADGTEFYEGDVWVGSEAAQYGLVDFLGDRDSFIEQFAREHGIHVRVKVARPRAPGLFRSLFLGAKHRRSVHDADAMLDALNDQLTEKALMNRIGL